MPRKKVNLPSTLERSEKKAQDTYADTLAAAIETYGDGERAHRTAFASLKHSYEKVGDHWEPKEHKGPSDDQAARGGADARQGGPTAGGVDANASKAHLLDVARRLEVKGRSRMTKAALVDAVNRANQRATARARQQDR